MKWAWLKRRWERLDSAKDECRDERAFEPLDRFLREASSRFPVFVQSPGLLRGRDSDTRFGHWGKYRNFQCVRGRGTKAASV